MRRNLSTARLRLRTPELRDLPFVTEFLSSSDRTRFLPLGRPHSPSEIRDFLEARIGHWTKGYGTYFLAEATAPDTLVGYAGVEEVAASGLDDLRFGLLSRVSGRGLALEAARAVVEEYFLGRHNDTLYGVCVAGNDRSLRILQTLGMKPGSRVEPYGPGPLVNLSMQAP